MEKRENNRRTWTGEVISKSGDKSIIIRLDTYKSHKLYGKRVKNTKKFHVHDEKNIAKIGDIAVFMESRPFSKQKKFILLNIKQVNKG